MPITVDQCRQYIQQGTQPMSLWTPAAEQLLLGTAIQESNLEYTEQIDGPALGYWEEDPDDHNDIWVNYLKYRPNLTVPIRALCSGTTPLFSLLSTNHPYAAAIARVHYLRVPALIPDLGDIEGCAIFWKKYYNTDEGAGTTDEFIANWNRFMPSPAV